MLLVRPRLRAVPPSTLQRFRVPRSRAPQQKESQAPAVGREDGHAKAVPRIFHLAHYTLHALQINNAQLEKEQGSAGQPNQQPLAILGVLLTAPAPVPAPLPRHDSLTCCF